MQELMKLANHMARRYYRRTYWRADLDDLRQEAALAALEAARTWDAQRGAPLDKHVMMNIIFRLRRYLHVSALPVTAGIGHEYEVHVQAVQVREDQVVVRPWEDIEWQARWEQVCIQMETTLQQLDPAGHCTKVLLEQQPCKKVAEEAGLKFGVLRHRVAEVRTALSKDGDLCYLLGLCKQRMMCYSR